MHLRRVENLEHSATACEAQKVQRTVRAMQARTNPGKMRTSPRCAAAE